MASSPPWRANATSPIPTAAGGRRPRRDLVFAGSNGRELAWWLDPVRALLFVVMPIFCLASYNNRYTYWVYDASEDFVTTRTFLLGLYSAGLLVLGMVLARLAVARRDTLVVIDEERALVVLRTLGWITIAAYVIYLGTLLVHLNLVLAFLKGDVSASSDLRDALGRIPGITSLVQLGSVYLALLSALVVLADLRPPPRMRVMTGIIIGLIVLRVLANSERLAMLEGMASIFVTPIAYRWRASVWRALFPVIALLLILILFASGEYFRSWQYYQHDYDSYLDFIVPRFTGYFSSSINNGAGAYLTIGQYDPRPEITVGWITHFPVLGALITKPEITLIDQFLATYASPEFNNPGGFYAAFIDYHFPIASAFMIVLGIVIGLAHRSFQNRSLLGLILYPVIFLGVTDFIRLVYITDVRAFPVFLGAFFAVRALRARTIPRTGPLPAPAWSGSTPR